MTGDWHLLAGAVALGALWGVGRDLSRLFRLSLGRPVSEVTAPYGHPPKKHPRLAVTPGRGRVWLFFHDALTLLLLGVSFRLLLFFLADGSFRLYALLGALGGFALWCGTLGRLWKKWVLPAAFLLRVSVGMLLLGLTLPLRLALGLLLRLWDRLRLASYRRRAMRYEGVRALFEKKLWGKPLPFFSRSKARARLLRNIEKRPPQKLHEEKCMGRELVSRRRKSIASFLFALRL